MNSNNLSVLVEAKKEYLFQLALVMCPHMTEVFTQLYEEAKKISKGKKVLLQYQRLLKEVSNWNDYMVKQKTDDICKGCMWFNDLLAALFVSYVKILSSVRITSENKKISLKLPTNELFIHSCYIAASKDFYKDPYIFHDVLTDYEREEKITTRLIQCIENTIKELVPVHEILKTYIAQESNRNVNLDTNDELEDTQDPDIDENYQLEAQSYPEEPEDPEGPEGPESPEGPEGPESPEGSEGPEEPEVKEINMSKNNDNVLFPNAPEN